MLTADMIQQSCKGSDGSLAPKQAYLACVNIHMGHASVKNHLDAESEVNSHHVIQHLLLLLEKVLRWLCSGEGWSW